MKLRNKKTGEIGKILNQLSEDNQLEVITDNKLYVVKSLAELEREWEDWEEPKEHWYIDWDGKLMVSTDKEGWEAAISIGNYFETKEEAQKAVEKLKAWKRLKDKDFQFHGHNALGLGEITFSLDFEDMDDEGEIGQLRYDLDLLFGGEE